jgi:hypothetical protein
MLPRYKAWKMINESFQGSYSLGVKTPRSLGFVGSKLAEMGFGPPDEEELDPDMLDAMGDEEGNQDPDLDDEEGGEFGDLSDVPVDGEFGGPGGDEFDDEEGGGDDLDGLDALGADGGDDFPPEDGGDELAGLLGHGGHGDEEGGGDDLAALLGHGGGEGGGFAGLLSGPGGEEGEEGEEGDLGDMSGSYEDLFGPGTLGGEKGGEPVGDQGPGAPDFGSDDLNDEDEENSDWEDEDEEDEDEEDEEEANEPEESDDDDKAEAFAKKKSKKFMCVDKSGKDHCDDETVYSKKYMKAGNKGDDLSGLTTKWMKREDADFFNSLIDAGKGEVHQKFNSGVSAPRRNVRQPQQQLRNAQPGEVGYAPQGRVGDLPSLGQYNEWKRIQGKRKAARLLMESPFSGEGMWTDDEVMPERKGKIGRGFQIEKPPERHQSFATQGGNKSGNIAATPEDIAAHRAERGFGGSPASSIDNSGQIHRPGHAGPSGTGPTGAERRSLQRTFK